MAAEVAVVDNLTIAGSSSNRLTTIVAAEGMRHFNMSALDMEGSLDMEITLSLTLKKSTLTGGSPNSEPLLGVPFILRETYSDDI